jgi:hypothetical protein
LPQILIVALRQVGIGWEAPDHSQRPSLALFPIGLLLALQQMVDGIGNELFHTLVALPCQSVQLLPLGSGQFNLGSLRHRYKIYPMVCIDCKQKVSQVVPLGGENAGGSWRTEYLYDG